MAARRSVRIIVAGAALLVVAGCGDGGADDNGGEAATSVSVTADEYSFDPPDVTAAADEDVEVALDNAGQLPHEWVVLSAGSEIASEAEFSEDLVEFEIEANPGADGSGSMNLPAGDYQVICAVATHFDQGMEGSLTLE